MTIASICLSAAAERTVVAGIASRELANRLAIELERSLPTHHFFLVGDLASLRQRAAHFFPRVLLLDYEIFEGAPLSAALPPLCEIAPVVLLAPPGLQSEIAPFVAEGGVEFVSRSGECPALAAALVQRRLRWAETSDSVSQLPWNESSGDIAEILRHEINNPLTGILGNAEMLLNHRDRLPAADTQRLQTVVDLAVRLRETVRRLSVLWDSQARPARSA
jgi:signal transduction histidine kinase